MDRRTFLERFGYSAAGAALLDADLAKAIRVLDQSDDASSITACDDIALFGVASDTSVEQWDHFPSFRGIMLRWFAKPGVGFPDYGYDLYRGPVAQTKDVPLNGNTAHGAAGKSQYSPSEDITIVSVPTITVAQLSTNAYSIKVTQASPVELRFPEPAWYVRLRARSSTSSLRALGYSRNRLRLNDTFNSGSVEWFTRGIDRIELLGTGEIVDIVYTLVCDEPKWTHLKHFCLPVSDPRYVCGPRTWTDDFDEARSRLPVPVQAAAWTGKYEKTFRSMYPTLTAVATHSAVPPFPASSDPDAPQFGLDPSDALRLAMLDPHVARMLGMAYDDALAPSGLDGKWYAYKIVGRWACETKTVVGKSFNPTELRADYGIVVTVKSGTTESSNGRLRVKLANNGSLRIKFGTSVDALSVTIQLKKNVQVSWTALDVGGRTLRSGKTPSGGSTERTITVNLAGLRVFELKGPADFEVVSICWQTPAVVERVGILPGIRATAVPAPLGPSWISSVVQQPAGCASPIEALLDWEIRTLPGGSRRPEDPLFYQAAAVQISTNPSASQPSAPPFNASYVLRDGDFILVPPALAAAPPPRVLMIDRDTGTGLPEGWRVWWARGVDLFGRASPPSPPVVRKCENVAAPPAPELVLTEYLQGDLPAAGGLGLSATARQWLAANPTSKGVLIAWAWTPELAEQCPDIDGFKCYSRRPVATPGAEIDEAAVTYEGVSWATPIASLGPTAVHFSGVVNSVDADLGSVTIAAARALDNGVWACTSNMTLDTGAGLLAGGTLSAGGGTYNVVGNGDGTNITLYVTAGSANTAPAPGNYLLQCPTVVRIRTTIAAPADPASFQQRFAGVLVTSAARYLVLADSGGTFVVDLAGATKPSAGDALEWFPAYVFVITDNGIGPQPSVTLPVAYAQLTVTSIRKYSTRQFESAPATPGTVVAVDTTVPVTPAPPAIASGTFCAEVATRPDWYGISRYTLQWTPDPNLKYTVYRALGDAINKFDAEKHDQTPVATHSIPSTSWPAEILTDTSRIAAVNADVHTLDADLATAFAISKTDLTRRNERLAALETAYAKLHADAQRVIANQEHVRVAYVARNRVPLASTELPFTDEFDGRARGRWFYRIASRTLAGVESGWTPATPPICAPDATPPSAPQIQVALSGDEKVRLRWLSSPDADLARYVVLRSAYQLSASDVRTMEEVASVAPKVTTAPPPGLASPTAVAGKTGWLEYAVDAKPAGDWFFRLVAEDVTGNRSISSNVIRGRSLKSAPASPTWTKADRSSTSSPTVVVLSWSHPTDSRLMCLVERRVSGGSFWAGVSDWLPRGTYSTTDTLPDSKSSYDYRLRVRDTLGQTAATLPIVTLSALP